jgi:hypothetical protein
MMARTRIVHRQIWRESGLSLGSRSIPEETAVLTVHDLASDLRDLLVVDRRIGLLLDADGGACSANLIPSRRISFGPS